MLVDAEPSAREICRRLRLLCPVELKTIHMSALCPPRPPDIVVVSGIDLRSVDMIAKTKRALQPFLLRCVPVVFLLDVVSVREDAQARSIGASLVLSADGGLREMARALEKLVGQGAVRRTTEREAELDSAVQDVALSLADLLTAAASGKEVSVALTAEASSLLLRTVRSHDVDRWLSTIATIHDLTYRHCMLMAGLMGAFAVSLGLNDTDCDRLTQAAILHDIGKAVVPVEILDKPDRLTQQEILIIRRHPEAGYRLLRSQGDHHRTTLDVVRFHHEYIDGNGYPLGLKGEQIGDEIRIATICDVFAALIEKRSYKAPLSPAAAYRMMIPMQDKLDPDLLRLFGELVVQAGSGCEVRAVDRRVDA